jgi:hypothetical protein
MQSRDRRTSRVQLLLRRRDSKVPSAKRILTAFMPLRRGPAVTQTTNFRDEPRAAPGMGFREL